MIRVGKKMLIMFGVFSVISSAVPLRAESSVDNNTADPEVHENFDPGTFIFDHISDSHEWPIMEIRHKNISVPLPVILRPWQIFLSQFSCCPERRQQGKSC